MASMNTISSRDVSPPQLKRRRLEASENKIPNISSREFTVCAWNVNGIEPLVQRPITSFLTSRTKGPKDSDDRYSTASMRDVLRRHHWPAIFCLQEVKINPDDRATISAVERVVRRQNSEDANLPSYRAFFSLPSDKFNARGFGRKIYGVCTLIREDFHDRCIECVRPVNWDREGRFLIAETKAVDGLPKLAIINVYAVNGTDNPYKDPETGEVTGTRHDRKLQVHALLQEECRKLEKDGFGVVVAGDMNIARASIDGFPNLRMSPKQHCVNRADFEARFISGGEAEADLPEDNKERPITGLGMVDSFRYLQPTRKGYTYFPRTRNFGDSCDRVDMILFSQHLKDSLREAGMHETPRDRWPSDHVPLFARLDFTENRGHTPGD